MDTETDGNTQTTETTAEEEYSDNQQAEENSSDIN